VSFDRAAEFYDETRGFPPGEEHGAAQVMAAVGGLTPESRVCEVGIGTGRIALPLAAHVGQMTGVDLSAAMLGRLLSKRGAEPCFPTQADATRLPFPDETFDAAVAVHIFHLIPNWQDSVREVARILRPGGVLITGWNDQNSGDIARANLWPIWAAASGVEQARNVGLPREHYQTFLTDLGWQPYGEQQTHRFVLRRTARDFVSQLERRVWSSTWRLADEAVERGLAAVYAAIEERQIDLDAPFSYEGFFVVEAYTPPE